MKILYGIQGTGNGHVSRARALIPRLVNHAQVDVLLSGYSSDIQINHPIKYRSNGIGFTFGKKGGIDFVDSIQNFKPGSFLLDVQNLDVTEYDLVISDYEPVTAWACKLASKPCLGVSHQASFYSPKCPRPDQRFLPGELLLRYYAPTTNQVGFHFQKYDDFIFTPIIRDEIRNLETSDGNHLTVYLPAYHHDFLVNLLKRLNIPVQIFSKHTQKTFSLDMCKVFPVSGDQYLQSLAGCKAVICGAGFESPAEVMFLGKKMICIPMKYQYEQECNAAALSQLGVLTFPNLSMDRLDLIHEWFYHGEPVHMHYDEITYDVIAYLLSSNPIYT